MNDIKYSQKYFYLIIKQNLGRLHYESGYSRARVAEEVGISFQAYSDMLTLSLIERYPSLETIRKFCNFFQVDVSSFFTVMNKERVSVN